MEVTLYNQSNPLCIDNSKRSDFVACPMKYYWTYVRGMHSLKGSTALRYGVVWHAAMEAFYGAVRESGWKSTAIIEKAAAAVSPAWDKYSEKLTFWDDYRTKENLMLSLMQFIDHYAGDEGMLKVIAPETKFKLDMVATRPSERDVLPFFFTGKIDLEVRLNGRLWIIDHKTTGQSLSVQVPRLNKSPQFMGYEYAARRILHENPEGALIMMHYLLSRKKKDGTYGKLSIDFQRAAQIYSDDDLVDWRASLFETVKQIQHCAETNTWTKRFDNCYQYGQCKYAFLCDQHRPEGEEVIEDNFYIDVPWDVLSEED